MFNKFELIGGAISVFMMAAAIYLVQVNTVIFNTSDKAQSATVLESAKPAVIIVNEEDPTSKFDQFKEAYNEEGILNSMIIDDIKLGDGDAVKIGDKVSVHYTGTFQDGREFDSSVKRGQPFEFTVGKGEVIKGWDEGLLGMQKGGHRVLVIPPDMAYGENDFGPIPGNSTLIFSIELVDVK